MKRFLLLLISVPFISLACSKREDTARSSPPSVPQAMPASLNQDPAAHFKIVITRFLDAVNKESLVLLPKGSRTLEYDVKKTDSLVSPFEATATIVVRTPDAPEQKTPGMITEIYQFTFPAQDGKWQFRNPKIDTLHFDDAAIDSAEKAGGKPYVVRLGIPDVTRQYDNDCFSKAWATVSQP